MDDKKRSDFLCSRYTNELVVDTWVGIPVILLVKRNR